MSRYKLDPVKEMGVTFIPLMISYSHIMLHYP